MIKPSCKYFNCSDSSTPQTCFGSSSTLIQTHHANISNWLTENTLGNLFGSMSNYKRSNIMYRSPQQMTGDTFARKTPSPLVPLNASSFESTWYSARWVLLAPAAPVERRVWERPGSALTKDLRDWSRKWQNITSACGQTKGNLSVYNTDLIL